MKRLVILTVALQLLAAQLSAADAPKQCTLCAGVETALAALPATTVPLLLTVQQDNLPGAATSPVWAALTQEQKKQLDILVEYNIEAGSDPLTSVEQHTKIITDWAVANGPFHAIGVDPHADSPDVRAYAIKRLAVTIQGQKMAGQILATSSLAGLPALFDSGAPAYFDVLLVRGETAAVAKWLLDHDPSKKLYAVVTPASPNALYDAARAMADGATRVFLAQHEDAGTFAAIASVDRVLEGDYAFDSSSSARMLDAKGGPSSTPDLTFVRGEDLATVIVPGGDPAAAQIVSLDGNTFAHPRRADAAGVVAITDQGNKGGRLLIGVQPPVTPFALIVDRAEKVDANVTKEAIDVNTHRGITVEEIIRNHQTYRSYEDSIQPRYIARDTTKLRFSIGDGGEAVEATIAGDYFSDPKGSADWVWQDFYINGVKWTHGRIPELPLIQPEKVTQLPLDLHLTNDYRYQLVRETDLLGYHTYEVRFDPPPNAPAALPLYRGTVWIDARTWARIRVSMIQMNLAGEILANEEQVDFVPLGRASHTPIPDSAIGTTDPREMLWLPVEVSAQQVVSAAGRANPVLRSTTFTNFQIDAPDYEQRHASASASNARMVRETPAGVRYLEKRPDGERVVKEGFENSRLFMLGGIHHDAGLDYPVVPLGGIDYFNFNLRNTGIQTNVFFAGVIIAANATHPNVGGTHTNVGLDFNGIAVPFTNSMYRDGREQKDEAVKAVPLSLTLRAGHPIFQFGKIDVSMGVSHITYQRAEDTAPTFQVPADTFVINPAVNAQYARWGYVISGFYEYDRRTSWEPWGNLSEYDPKQKSFTTFGGAIGKNFYLPKFQRIGVEVNYLDGQRLDRFSKYELGFFGSQRIHGISSGSVRAEKAILAHLSYGFVINEQLRMEAFYDHGILNDRDSGLHHAPYQGVGIGGQTIGPYGTILRLDLGKSVGQNAQSGFVANVILLKLF